MNGAIGKVAGCWVKKSKKSDTSNMKKAADGSITIIAEDGTESTTAKKLSSVQPFCASALKVGDKVNSFSSKSVLFESDS